MRLFSRSRARRFGIPVKARAFAFSDAPGRHSMPRCPAPPMGESASQPSRASRAHLPERSPDDAPQAHAATAPPSFRLLRTRNGGHRAGSAGSAPSSVPPAEKCADLQTYYKQKNLFTLLRIRKWRSMIPCPLDMNPWPWRTEQACRCAISGRAFSAGRPFVMLPDAQFFLPIMYLHIIMEKIPKPRTQ